MNIQITEQSRTRKLGFGVDGEIAKHSAKHESATAAPNAASRRNMPTSCPNYADVGSEILLDRPARKFWPMLTKPWARLARIVAGLAGFDKQSAPRRGAPPEFSEAKGILRTPNSTLRLEVRPAILASLAAKGASQYFRIRLGAPNCMWHTEFKSSRALLDAHCMWLPDT